MSKSLHDNIIDLKKLKILFVEDEKDLLDIISETLEKLEVKFLTASNGKEGLDIILNNDDIDLVVTDISMPVMNGLDMIKEFKETKVDLPVIIMTAHTESQYIDEAKIYGIDDYLLKPFDFIKFIELVSEKKIK